MQTITQRHASNYIARREAFRASAMSAIVGQVTDTGDLPERWAERYRADDPSYTVLSYSTPIGWVASDGTPVVPGVRYSLTTTQHQHHLARGFGIALSDVPDEGRAVPVGHYEPRMGW